MIQSIGLCKGRHNFPSEVSMCVFGEIKDPLNIKSLERRADELFKNLKNEEIKEVNLYVTGLSTA